MIIKKDNLEEYLNSFSWDFREIFIEKSKSFRVSFVNGKFKTPYFSSLEWVSFLSRTWKKESFQVFDNLDDLQKNTLLFRDQFFLNENIKEIKLSWEKELFLEEIKDISFDLEEIFSYTQDAYEQLIKDKNFISSSEITLNLSKKSFVVWNTSWNFWRDTNFYNTYFIKLVWERDVNIEEVYEKITWTDIMDKINKDEIFKTISFRIDVLDKQLSWVSRPNWVIDVIIWNESWWTIIHEAVWHWLEADLQNSSVYKDKIWQKVASELVSIVDNPTTKFERWYYNIDHEWNNSKNTVLIENWILKSYLHNTKTASNFWVESTWHWRKETYKHKTLVRMGNTYMLPWKDKKEDLIKRVKYWLYVSRMWWWQVNTTTWDFVFKVQNWFLIEDGKLTKNVRWATISWNWPQMLNEIYWVCDDLDFFDWWTCGKGQSMPVSDWVPTLLTKLKVSAF